MSWTRALYFGLAITLTVIGAGALIGQYFGAVLSAAVEGVL